MNKEVKVTQGGKVMPTTGSIIVVTLNKKTKGELNTYGELEHRYIVVRVDGQYALVPLFGLAKGVATKTFRKIPQLVEAINENRYLKDWVVEGEEN